MIFVYFPGRPLAGHQCRIAREVADEGGALVAGGICPQRRRRAARRRPRRAAQKSDGDWCENSTASSALVAGGICQCPAYRSGLGKESVQGEFKKQIDCFVKNNVDFIICEHFEHVEESLWALDTHTHTQSGVCGVEAVKKWAPGMPVAVNLCIGELGNVHGVSAGHCAVQMAKGGADIVGVNCRFGPNEPQRRGFPAGYDPLARGEAGPSLRE
eukprot:gene26346-2139_t